MNFIHSCKKSRDQGVSVWLCNSSFSVTDANDHMLDCISFCPYCGDDLNEAYDRVIKERRAKENS